jgi:DNA-binding NtrC family response regulator
MQVKLLRVLQESEFERVGGIKTISVDVRLITATNADLARATEAGTFREDLYYRLNVVPIRIPPLRERQEDIPLLVQHFIRRFNEKLGKTTQGLSEQAMAVLRRHGWPGNIRELENLLERTVLFSDHEVIQVSDLPQDLLRPLSGAVPADGATGAAGRPAADPSGAAGFPDAEGAAGAVSGGGPAQQRPAATGPMGHKDTGPWGRSAEGPTRSSGTGSWPASEGPPVTDDCGLLVPDEDDPSSQPVAGSLKEAVKAETVRVEREMIVRALDETGGNVTRAAKLLQISRKSLQIKMKELGLRRGEELASVRSDEEPPG